MLEPNAILQGRYLILRPIGQGGMGAVYLARDERLGNVVALKETFFSDERMLRAFEREARLLASLRHPALPRVSDHFAEGTGQFLVMEYIAGDDLEKMLTARGHAFAPADVLQWADQLLDALDYLHTQQPPIIHRDIKPQNLKLTERGQIILLDFGLAKGAASGMTQAAGSSSILGYTPGYAALEQIQGTGTDPRSDLYSLAATLYILMTGTAPPQALSRASAVVNGEPDPLALASFINPQVPMAVASVLHRAMALKRDQRPATARAMREALREASGAPATGAAASIAMGSPPAPPTAAAGYGQTMQATADSGLIAPVPTYPAARHPGTTNAPAMFATQPTALRPARSRTLLVVLIGVIIVMLGVAAFVLMNRRPRPRRVEVITPPAPINPSPNTPPGGNVGGVPGGIPEGIPGSTPTGKLAPAPPSSEKKEGSQPREIRKSGGVLQASATRRIEPDYPPLAKTARVAGMVVVEVTVDEQGNVISARAISGHPLLQDAAVRAARGWKFEPTKLNGVPVRVIGTITFNFQM